MVSTRLTLGICKCQYARRYSPSNFLSLLGVGGWHCQAAGRLGGSEGEDGAAPWPMGPQGHCESRPWAGRRLGACVVPLQVEGGVLILWSHVSLQELGDRRPVQFPTPTPEVAGCSRVPSEQSPAQPEGKSRSWGRGGLGEGFAMAVGVQRATLRRRRGPAICSAREGPPGAAVKGPGGSG